MNYGDRNGVGKLSRDDLQPSRHAARAGDSTHMWCLTHVSHVEGDKRSGVVVNQLTPLDLPLVFIVVREVALRFASINSCFIATVQSGR